MKECKQNTATVVWLNLDWAKIFHFSDERMEREELRAHLINRYVEGIAGGYDRPLGLFDALAAKLTESNRLLVLGPGLARVHFVERLKEKFPAVAKRVVACEPSEHDSDPLIAAYAMKYFRRRVG